MFATSASDLPIIYKGDVPASKRAIDLGVVRLDANITSESLLAALDAARELLHADAFVAQMGSVRERYFCDGCGDELKATGRVLSIFLPRLLLIPNPSRGIAGNAGLNALSFERNTFFRAVRFIAKDADRDALQKPYTDLTIAFLKNEITDAQYDERRAVLPHSPFEGNNSQL